MPTMTQTVTTEATVKLTPKLTQKIQAQLDAYRERARLIKDLESQQDDAKETIENLFASAGEYEALVSGVRVDTPFGPVPVKIVEGETSTLDKALLMKRYRLSPEDLDSCTKRKPKKAYLSITLPKEKE